MIIEIDFRRNGLILRNVIGYGSSATLWGRWCKNRWQSRHQNKLNLRDLAMIIRLLQREIKRITFFVVIINCGWSSLIFIRGSIFMLTVCSLAVGGWSALDSISPGGCTIFIQFAINQAGEINAIHVSHPTLVPPHPPSDHPPLPVNLIRAVVQRTSTVLCNYRNSCQNVFRWKFTKINKVWYVTNYYNIPFLIFPWPFASIMSSVAAEFPN